MDKENRLFLREFISFPIEGSNRDKQLKHEYIIWGNYINIMRIKVSKYIFLDARFQHPPEFYQMLILMCKDIVTKLKIPGLYILMKSKKEILYKLVFESLIHIELENSKRLNFEIIVTGHELGLIKSVNKFFPESQRIGCLFHYKQDILRNLKSYCLYKGKFKNSSLNLLEEL